MDSKRLTIALILCLLGAALSGVLLLQHHGEPSAVSAVAQVCGAGETNGCDAVNQSAWSKLLGVPLAAIGVAFYLSLAALLLLGLQAGDEGRVGARAAATLLMLALAADVVLLGLQAFSIGAFCKLCLVTYALNAAALFALWPSRQAGLPSSSLAGRLVACGWGVATLAAVLFAMAWNSALTERAERRAGAILGAPLGSAAAGAKESGGAQSEVARLKAILDDPHKYEEYQQQKAVSDFEIAKPQDIATNGVPLKGPADAPIVVVEYSDFLCPYCRAIAGAFRDFIPQAQGRASVRFKHYPLDKACTPSLNQTIHPGACLLAKGAICANAQGRFWEYHDKVFSAPPQNPDRSRVVSIAAAAGLDAEGLGSCLDSPETAARLKVDIDEAQRLGVNSTPTIFINGKRLTRVNDFLLMMDKESQRLRLPPLQPAKP